MSPPTELTLGGIFPSSGGWSVGPSVYPAFQLAVDEINNSTTLLPSTTLKYYLNDSQCDETIGLTQLLYQNTYPRSIDVIIGDGCSIACQAEARIAEIWKMPQISWGCTSPSLSNKDKFPYFLRTVAPDTIVGEGFAQYIRDLTPWRSIAWLSEDALLFTMTYDAFRDAQLAYPNDPIESDHQVFAAGDGVATDLEVRLQAIKDSGKRIWVIASYAENGRRILKLAHKIGLTGPGYQVFIAGGIGDCILANPQCPGADGSTVETDQELIDAAQGAIATLPWVPSGEVAYDGFLDKMVSKLSLTDRSQVNSYAVTAYEAVYSYANAAHNFIQSDDIRANRTGFMKTLRSSSCPGVLGDISFNSAGDRPSTLGVVNFDYGTSGDSSSNGIWTFTHKYNGIDGLVAVPGNFPTLYTGGTPTQPPVDNIIVAATVDSSGVSLPVVFGGLGAFIFIIAGLYFWNSKKETKLKNAITKLEEELTLLKSYGEEEQRLIGEEIQTFRENFARHRETNKGDKTDAAGGRELDKFLIPAVDVRPEEQIGKGSFGEVFLANYRGQKVAVKTMNTIDEANLERFRDEIILMSDLRHQNVVFMVGACWETQLMALVLEYCQHGTATDNLNESCSWDDPLFKWAKDTACGISYLHSVSFYDVKNEVMVKNIIHRDVKPDNCLITDTFGVKVSDFGEARMSEDDKTMTMVGTPFYVAPEVVRGERYSASADVYSYGLTILTFALRGRYKLSSYLKKAFVDDKNSQKEMVVARGGLTRHSSDDALASQRKAPTKEQDVSDNRVAHSMVNKKWRPRDIQGNLGIPPSVATLIEICWLEDQFERPSFKEIVDYLTNECMAEIMGTAGSGTGRRASTSGLMAARIEEAKIRKIAQQKEIAEGKMSVAISENLGSMDTERRAKVVPALADLVRVFESGGRGADEEEIEWLGELKERVMKKRSGVA